MDQGNFSRNSGDRTASNQILQEQQGEIDGIVHSLGQIFDFLEHQKKQGSTDISDLSSAMQESIKYLTVVVNNLEYLGQEMDLVRPNIVLVKSTIDKANHLQIDTLDDIKNMLRSLQKEQDEIQDSILMIKKTLVLQQSSHNDMFDWKNLLIVWMAIVIPTFFISGLVVSTMTTRYNETNDIMSEKIQKIQDYLGIKNKGVSKAKKGQ